MIFQVATFFATGIAVALLAVTGFLASDRGDRFILIVGVLTTLLMFAAGFFFCLIAVEDDGEEVETLLQGIAGNHGLQYRNQQPDGIQLPAIAIAQLEQVPPANDDGAGGIRGDDDCECVVCLGKVGDDGLATRKLTACRHVFHKHCIEQWLRAHPTCPTCRSNARQDSLEAILRLNT
jgi:hypothetical protein